MQIDHDPEEPKIDRRPESFRALFAILVLLWIGNLYFFSVDWRSIILGIGTGGALMLWASMRFRDRW